MHGRTEEPRRPGNLESALHVLVLFGFAVAQPLYDLLGGEPAFFIFRRFQPLDFWLFAGLLSLGLPTAWAALLRLLPAPVRPAAHAVSLGLLGTLIVLPPLGSLEGVPAWLTVGFGVAIGAAFGVLWLRRSRLRSFLTWLTPSVVIFAGIFLSAAGIRDQWLVSGGPLVGTSRAGAAPSVVLVVFDGLPTTSLMDVEGGIDSSRYPNFARLASEADWYRLHTTVSPVTITAVPAILAGQCAQDAGAPTFASYPQNLFTFLAGSHEMVVSERVTNLCPPELCGDEPSTRSQRLKALSKDARLIYLHRLLPLDWASKLPPVNQGWGDFGNRRRVNRVGRFREFVASIEPGEDAALFFNHTVLPHEPFYYLPSGTWYRKEEREPAGASEVLGSDPWVARHGYQRHLLQVGLVDKLLGELLAKLEATGRYEKSLVIVTADHGSSFREGEARRRISTHNPVDILPVPLFVKAPGQKVGEVRDEPVQTVDILPLIAELRMAEPSWSDGSWPRRPASAGQLSCPDLLDDPAPSVTISDLLLAAGRKDDLFGSAQKGEFFSRVGPRPALIGMRANTGACPPAEDLAVEVENEAAFEAVHLGEYVPAEIVGVARGANARTTDLAVAVNGVVKATTRAYELGTTDAAVWSAIVPESAFVEGANRLEVFAAADSGDPCPLSPVLRASTRLSYLDTRLGVWKIPLVEEIGWRLTLRTRDRTMRWTNGRGA